MATLLVVHHTVSPPLAELLEAVLDASRAEGLEDVRVRTRAALAGTASDVLAADGLVLLTPANLGYMSGALKHFLDTVYYPCLTETRGLPYALVVHGNNDVTGAVRSVEAIANGLAWRRVCGPLEVTGPVDRTAREKAYELGATVAATLLESD